MVTFDGSGWDGIAEDRSRCHWGGTPRHPDRPVRGLTGTGHTCKRQERNARTVCICHGDRIRRIRRGWGRRRYKKDRFVNPLHGIGGVYWIEQVKWQHRKRRQCAILGAALPPLELSLPGPVSQGPPRCTVRCRGQAQVAIGESIPFAVVRISVETQGAIRMVAAENEVIEASLEPIRAYPPGKHATSTPDDGFWHANTRCKRPTVSITIPGC